MSAAYLESRLLAVLSIVTVLGVIALQVFLLGSAYELEERAFDQSAYAALVSSTGRLDGRIRQAVIDSVLRRAMLEAGIHLEFSYGIIAAGSGPMSSDTPTLVVPRGSGARLLASKYRVPIPSDSSTEGTHGIAVDFPGRSLHLLGRIALPLVVSVVLVTLLTMTLFLMIRRIRHQGLLVTHLNDFVHNVTREFKEPLARIEEAAEAIRRPDILPQQDEIVQLSELVSEETARMGNQVGRILEFAELEEGRVVLSLGETDMHHLIRSIANGVRPQAEVRGGRFDLQLGAGHHTVTGDAQRLRRVLHNLIDNAVKFSVGPPTVLIRTQNRGDLIAVEVVDGGEGIPSADLKRVFEKYFRSRTGVAHTTGGFGLGLSYVKLLVEAHDGEVTLESNEGQGTRVTVLLPLSHSFERPAGA